MNAPIDVTQAEGPQPDARPHISPEDWVANHGDHLFRHALARTGRPEMAEDMVQETFLAAWKSAHRFAGRASERTWLLRILRNKIADHYRRQQTEITLRDVEALSQLEEQQFAQTWLGGRAWSQSGVPATWMDARKSLEQAEFWQALHACTHKLPAMTARVFLMRELDGLESPAICRELNIKPSHLFVMLHRARLALRRCLELNWFKDAASRT
jgi:RNA polymerase sigma-70 factor (TIGR02943 family)